MEPHSRLRCGPGPNKGRVAPIRPAGSQRVRSSEYQEQCWAPHVLLTLMHELLPQREPEETGEGGGKGGARRGGSAAAPGQGPCTEEEEDSSAKPQQLMEGLRSQSSGPGEAQWCFSSLKLLECSLGCLQSGFPFSWDPRQDLVFVSRL